MTSLKHEHHLQTDAHEGKADQVKPREVKKEQHRPNTINNDRTSRCWFGSHYPTQRENDLWEESRVLPEFPFGDWYEPEGGKRVGLAFAGQWEQGDPDNKHGRLHFQFCLKLHSPKGANSVRKLLGSEIRDEPWLEPCASEWASQLYCTKGETRVGGTVNWGWGDHKLGYGTAMDQVYAAIRKGMPIYQVMETYPSQYSSRCGALSKMCTRYERGRQDLWGIDMKIEVEIWWGVTSAGKSTVASLVWPEAYVKIISDKWWDGYRGQETVIFEDYEYYNNNMMEKDRPQKLKTWWDKKNCLVEVKNGSCQLLAKRFIYTTNEDPQQWFKDVSVESKRALCRRLTKIRHFTVAYSKEDKGKARDAGIFEAPGLIVN